VSEVVGEFADASILLRAADGSTVRVHARGAITGMLRIDEKALGRQGSPFLRVVHDITLTLTGEVEIDAEHDMGTVVAPATRDTEVTR
jgi:hypothetical protein